MIAALFVDPAGVYSGLPDVECWGEDQDARRYRGPWPVIAHPPCQRWGRFWHGSTRKPHQYLFGDDKGCFCFALAAVRTFGGVLEHPAHTHAWKAFSLPEPAGAGWTRECGPFDGWTCSVEQGHYGHFSRKASWLYACRAMLPDLDWSRGAQRIHPRALELYGYEKARRVGMLAMIGGKDKTKIRNATPIAFRDVLLGIARSVRQ